MVAFDIKALVVQLHEVTFQHSLRTIQKVYKVCAYSPRTSFVAARHLVAGVQFNVEKLPRAVVRQVP